MYWWAVILGKQLVGSALVAIRDGEHWCRLVVAVRGGGCWHCLVVVIHLCSLLTSFIAVHHAPLSIVRLCPLHIVKLFCIAGLVLGIR